jgi:DNA-binding NtrC family response regulator
VLAATNRDLDREVERGAFRSDLLFRLNAVELRIPPLRQRQGEIPQLAAAFLAEECRLSGRQPVPSLSERVLERLLAWHWPGNVRELKKAMELALVLCDGQEIDLPHLHLHGPALAPPTPAPAPARNALIGAAAPPAFAAPAGSALSPAQQEERQRMLDALVACLWNQSAAARRIGMSRRTFVARMIRYGIPRPRAAPPG